MCVNFCMNHISQLVVLGQAKKNAGDHTEEGRWFG